MHAAGIAVLVSSCCCCWMSPAVGLLPAPQGCHVGHHVLLQHVQAADRQQNHNCLHRHMDAAVHCC
jgi:hypothetical protein